MPTHVAHHLSIKSNKAKSIVLANLVMPLDEGRPMPGASVVVGADAIVLRMIGRDGFRRKVTIAQPTEGQPLPDAPVHFE